LTEQARSPLRVVVSLKENHVGTFVTETPTALLDIALRHFEGMRAFETDGWGVHRGLKSPEPDFVLIDVRGLASFVNEHVSRTEPC
jgi:hypothetical protein